MSNSKRQASELISNKTSFISIDTQRSFSKSVQLTDPTKRSRLSGTISYLEPTFEKDSVKCFYCEVVFDNLIKFECHKLLYRHIGPPKTKFVKITDWIKCQKCKKTISITNQNPVHKCHKKLEDELANLYRNINSSGIPLYCILCEAKPMHSRGELIIHLIAFHSDNLYSNCCSICNCSFRSTSVFMKSEHMKNEHLGEMEINFLKLTSLHDAKQLTLSSFNNPMICIYKVGKLQICGKKFDNLSHFTLHVLCNHCKKFQNQDKSFNKKKDELFNMTLVHCNRCDLSFPSDKELQQHISEYHQIIYEKHLDYLVDTGGFDFKYNALQTCMLCMKSFDNQILKDVHTYVTHWSQEWPHCGLCFTDIFDNPNNDLSDNLQYKYLLVHEKFHAKFIDNFINQKETDSELVKDFDLSLISKPKLYIGTYVPIKITEQQEIERKQRKRVFPKEFKQRLIHLGNKNHKVQEALEIFG